MKLRRIPKGYESVDGIILTEPRIEAIRRELQDLLSVVQLEVDGMTPLGANERAWEHLPRPDAGLQGLLQLRRRPASGPG